LASGAGWLIKDWKDGAEIVPVRSQKNDAEARNSILGAANQQCGTNIESVRAGIKTITDAVGKREEAARTAMSQAETLVAKHTKAAQTIKQAPPVPQDQQFAAIEREQVEYIKTRRAESE
jgi:hypothetical protein